MTWEPILMAVAVTGLLMGLVAPMNRWALRGFQRHPIVLLAIQLTRFAVVLGILYAYHLYRPGQFAPFAITMVAGWGLIVGVDVCSLWRYRGEGESGARA